jgi:hypothetical protein
MPKEPIEQQHSVPIPAEHQHSTGSAKKNVPPQVCNILVYGIFKNQFIILKN